MNDYHEPIEKLDEHALNCVRALKSLMEEVEAVNWYHQRIAASNDEDLKHILEHNRNEEIEHACMALEWLRKNMPGWDEEMRRNLFKEDKTDETNENDSLNIGNLKNMK
ncbi:encapsulin-associated ferritin-like protein [Haloplasma contractile]|uniref:Ferritin n=1 Tax=Haloplasma contractile SSD-17B TaxID=1033810 RepID=U2DW04_9MOLU|nr:ferritin-like domain-containing protein [Haloplasma contractile]ERJ12502.1 hypothetical protein HLPCO_001488 [Haloplasma contractile SSD-17B]